jgi:menaquinone-dependent protoporphyrinogen oxidase
MAGEERTMKTLIVYATRHGAAEKCAGLLADRLGGDVDVFDLKKVPTVDLSGYDAVVVGGSIHAGRVQSRVKKFCEAHADALLKKKLGLFICCMEEGDKAWKQFHEAFPARLVDQAAAKGLFGGAFDFDRMNWFEKTIIGKIAGVKESVCKINEPAVAEFADKMKSSVTVEAADSGASS